MDIVEIAALIVFIATYSLIAVHKLPWFEVKRHYAASIGALLMILVGAVAIGDAFDSIDFDVIFLLLGMMVLVAGLEYAGFFTLVSDYLVQNSSSRIRLLAMIMAISAILSAIALNDAVVLMFTPIVIRCCSKIGTNPIPYLVGMMMSANIGSIATAVGNPQNAYIISVTGIDFITYSLYSLPIAAVCMFVAFACIFMFYRKHLSEPYETNVSVNGDMFGVDKKRLTIMIAITVCTFVGFSLSGIFGYKLYQVALFAGLASLMVIVSHSFDNAKWVVKHVNWGILVFFIGLFILIAGAVHSGIINDISSLFPGFGSGETPDVVSLSVFSVVLSNLVSNVPAVMLITQMMPVSDLPLWIALAASSTLAGNATLIGSAANIIVAEKSEDYGVKIDFFRFLIVGIFVTAVTVAAMILVIDMMFIS